MNRNMKKRYKIVAPVRFFCFILIIVMIIAMGIATIFSSRTAAADVNNDTATYTEVTVRHTDTLWSLADEFGPDDTDLRIVVSEICRVNGITADQIQPGDTVKVPVAM